MAIVFQSIWIYLLIIGLYPKSYRKVLPKRSHMLCVWGKEKSMTYFEDAELQKDNPHDLKGMSWKQIKTKMKKAVDGYVKGQL